MNWWVAILAWLLSLAGGVLVGCALGRARFQPASNATWDFPLAAAGVTAINVGQILVGHA